MIEIDRAGSELRLKLSPKRGILAKWFFTLTWECGNDETYASLLVAEMQKQLGNLVQDIRRKEYEAGYKDGRAKRGKRGWFSCRLLRET